VQQLDRVPAWKQMVEEFEKDQTMKNPYEIKITGERESLGLVNGLMIGEA
jgi:hypothetical protein